MKTYTVVNAEGFVVDCAYTAEEAAEKQRRYAEENNN
jgi:hypothetical protein